MKKRILFFGTIAFGILLALWLAREKRMSLTGASETPPTLESRESPSRKHWL